MRRKTGGKRRIMIVDDDPTFLAAARGWLEPHYDVTTLYGGEKLREILGSVFCRAQPLNKKWRSMPVMFMTGRQINSFYGRNIAIVGKNYLSEPTNSREFIPAIETILQGGID
jgi:hypothetical protein